MKKHLYVPYDPKNLGCNIYKTSTYNRNLRVGTWLFQQVASDWLPVDVTALPFRRATFCIYSLSLIYMWRCIVHFIHENKHFMHGSIRMFVRQGRKQEREEKMFCCSYFSWDTFRGKLPLPSTVYLFSKVLL